LSRDADFACGACGYRSAKWLGRCPECGAWNTLAERRAAPQATATLAPRPLSDLSGTPAERLPTGLAELDRVLGGGIVPGSVVLIGGEPGIGKSTLLLQAGAAVAAGGRTVLYLSGEEAPPQIRLRAERLAASRSDVLVACDTDVERMLATAREIAPALVVVDSIQSVRCADLGAQAGGVAQVREAAARFVALAKETGTPVLLVGHVTKDGTLAGPRTLEHLVDAVLQFEGDRHHAQRLLRALKNRFGPTDELGVFSMAETGLVEVPNPSELFLGRRGAPAPGSTVLPALLGSRPLLVEIQALVGEPVQGSPRRTALGLDAARMAMLLALIQRWLGIELAHRDVFANAAGGVEVVEPAADLALFAALVSSATRRAIASDWVILGEIGLGGEVRAVSGVAARLREAARLGFRVALVPQGSPGRDAAGIDSTEVDTLGAAARKLFGGAVAPQIG
jgi:DNA repair protein RadA/Sms